MRKNEYIAACTRAHAMKSSLLSSADWSRIAMMNSAEEIMVWLKQCGMIPSTVSVIENAEKNLRESNISITSALIRFLHGTPYTALKYFIYFYDLLNIESVIYNLHTGTENNNLIDLLYDTGRQGLVRAELLASITSYPALANSLHGTFLYDIFKYQLAEYEREGNITSFIAGIELEFLRLWNSAIKQCNNKWHIVGNNVFDVFIKVKAADAIMRMKFNRDEHQHNIDAWTTLIGQSVPKNWKDIADENESYINLMKMIFPQYRKRNIALDSIQMVERQMMRGLREAVMRTQQQNNFSLDYLISFLLLVMLQTEDLIRTLECKDFGLNTDVLNEYLIKEL